MALTLLLDVPAAARDGRALRVTTLLGLLVLAAAVYFAAVRLILRCAWPCCTVWIVVGVAIAVRLLLLTAPPILSSDIYRYVWDGRVQAAGINPYRYVPADPALAFLKDPTVYPQINRADYARTIYPPLVEVAFAITGKVSDDVTGIRLVMLGFEAVGVICLLRLLPLAGLPRLVALPLSATLIYAAVVAMAFLALAVGILWQPAPANDAKALCRDTGLLAAAAMAATSPHYHRYFAWLALSAVVAPSRALIWLGTAPRLLIKEPVPGDRFFWPSRVYVPAILLLLADLRPWLAIKLRRGAENGETQCALRLP